MRTIGLTFEFGDILSEVGVQLNIGHGIGRMMDFLKSVAGVSAPLALAGLLASFLFYAIREIIRAKLIPAVSKKHALTIVLAIINKLFILSLVALILGITTYALERLLLPDRPSLGGMAVKVYYFENYGRMEEEAQTGERFSGLILDNLLRRNLKADTTPERYVSTRGPNTHIMDEFHELGPFISITGYVEGSDGGKFLAHIRVIGINARKQTKVLMIDEFEVPRDQVDMRVKAAEISEVIYRTIQSFVGGATLA